MTAPAQQPDPFRRKPDPLRMLPHAISGQLVKAAREGVDVGELLAQACALAAAKLGGPDQLAPHKHSSAPAVALQRDMAVRALAAHWWRYVPDGRRTS